MGAKFLKSLQGDDRRFVVACNIYGQRIILHSHSCYLIKKLVVEGRPEVTQKSVEALLQHSFRMGQSLLLSYCVPFAGGNDDCHWDLRVLKTGCGNPKNLDPVLGVSSDDPDVRWREKKEFEFELCDDVRQRLQVYTEEFARTSTVIDMDIKAECHPPKGGDGDDSSIIAANKRLTGLVDALVKERRALLYQVNSNESAEAAAAESRNLKIEAKNQLARIAVLEAKCAKHDAELKASSNAIELALGSNSEQLSTAHAEKQYLASAMKAERLKLQERLGLNNEVIADLRSQLDVANTQLQEATALRRVSADELREKARRERQTFESESILLRESYRAAQADACKEKHRSRELEKQLQLERDKFSALLDSRCEHRSNKNSQSSEFVRTNQARRIVKLTRQCDFLVSMVRETAGEILSDPLNIGTYSSSC